MEYELTRLKESDIPALARLHCKVFPDSRSTQLGQLYVRKMFKWFYITQPQLCFVAKQGNALVGYVVGAVGGMAENFSVTQFSKSLQVLYFIPACG